jgi:hypothetical protein
MYRKDNSVFQGTNRQRMVEMNQNRFQCSKVLHLEETGRFMERDVRLNDSENKTEFYTNQMKPILDVMRIFAIFPVELSLGT